MEAAGIDSPDGHPQAHLAPPPPADHSDDGSNTAGTNLSPSASSNASPNAHRTPHPPSLRTTSDSGMMGMTTSSTPLGQVNAARRPQGPPPMGALSGRSNNLTPEMQNRLKNFHLSRQGAPPGQPVRASPSNGPGSPSPVQGAVIGGIPVQVQSSGGSSIGPPPLSGGIAGLRLPPQGRPVASSWSSAPSIPGQMAQNTPPPLKMGGLGKRRGLGQGLKLSDASGPATPAPDGQKPGDSGTEGGTGSHTQSLFSKYSEYIDTQKGTLNFKNKAIVHGGGIEFSSGSKFSISLDEVDMIEELGKGNYGTVYKVRHSRPKLRKPGQGIRGIVSRYSDDLEDGSLAQSTDSLTGAVMAMKEIRLELDESKFAAIIMELDILHRCLSPFIIDFYGAFFQEGAVYMCVEFMDGGSVDKLYRDGIPEDVLRKIALSTTMGLKCLKDEHNIIHRDVKPTNILINTKGQIKICDFGVSGNLVASIAKTNIGCQSYMAPERIAGGGVSQAGAAGGTYSVQSDIWSLGLTIIECAIGRYPYPPETYTDIFSQLSSIVHGDPPSLPEEGYSAEAHDFVQQCLRKDAAARPSYARLLRHPWLVPLMTPPSNDGTAETAAGENGESADSMSSPGIDTSDKEVAEWVANALGRRKNGVMGQKEKPALHAVALDAVPGSPLLEDPGTISPIAAAAATPTAADSEQADS